MKEMKDCNFFSVYFLRKFFSFFGLIFIALLKRTRERGISVQHEHEKRETEKIFFFCSVKWKKTTRESQKREIQRVGHVSDHSTTGSDPDGSSTFTRFLGGSSSDETGDDRRGVSVSSVAAVVVGGDGRGFDGDIACFGNNASRSRRRIYLQKTKDVKWRQQRELYLPSVEIDVLSVHVSLGCRLIDPIDEVTDFLGQVQFATRILKLKTDQPHAIEGFMCRLLLLVENTVIGCEHLRTGMRDIHMRISLQIADEQPYLRFEETVPFEELHLIRSR